MRKYLILLCVLALICGTVVYARMNVGILGGSVPAAGGPAASGVRRPDGDVSNGANWFDSDWGTAHFYSDLDDAVTSPTAGDGTEIAASDTATTTLELTLEEVTGSETVTTVRVHVYAKVGGSDDGTIGLDISQDGSTWEGGGKSFTITLDNTYAWFYDDFTVSWTDTSDFRLRLSNTSSVNYRIDTAYVEMNP